MSGLTFDSPGWLWPLLLLLPLIWWMFRRRKWMRWLQVSVLFFLLAAAAQPVFHGTSGEKRRIAFLTAEAELPPELSGWETVRFSGSPTEALLTWGAQLPDGGGSLALVGALHERDHELDSALETLARRRIPVRVVLAPAPNLEDAVALQALRLPPVAGCGMTAELRLTLWAEVAQTVDVRVIEASGEEVSAKSVALVTGENQVTLPLPLRRAGGFFGMVELNGKAAAPLAMAVRPAYDAILYSLDFEREAPRFQRLLGQSARVVPPGERTTAPLLLFGEGVLARFSPEQQRLVAGRVRAGAGVLTLTGREALFHEDAVLPEFAALFPVRYEGEQEKKLPTVSLVVIIDTSGSMRGPRIDLAREVARLALEHLRDNDLAGVVEFHGSRRWAAPLQSASNQFSLMRALNRLNAGGGTVILPAIAEAFQALRNTHTRLKHVLVLTDGGVEYGDFESLIRRMAEHDITLSTVLVGPGKSEFLSRLALWGNGRFYRASSRFALPDLEFRPQAAEPLPVWREGPLALTGGSRGVASVLSAGHSVSGVVKSELRPGARPLLWADDVPLAASLRSAWGTVAVWNGDWSDSLLQTAEAPGFFSAWARSLPDPALFDGITVVDRSAWRDLDWEFETAVRKEQLSLSLTSLADGAVRHWKLLPSPEGRFRFRVPNLPEGVYQVNLENYSESWYWVSRRASPAGGFMEPARADEINRIAEDEATEPIPAVWPLAPIFAGVATVLFLLQLGLRRRVASWSVLLVGFAGFASSAADYGALLRRGARLEEHGAYREAADHYRQAMTQAATGEDRRFAALLAWENLRRSGEVLPLTERADFPADLAVAEYEERGELTLAWELAVKHFGDTPEGQERLLALAMRIGRREWVLEQSRRLTGKEESRDAGLGLAVRQALLDGDRKQAETLYQKEVDSCYDPARLWRIASAAEHQNLPEVAVAALRRAAVDEFRWPSRFALLDFYRRQGMVEQAVSSLLDWMKESAIPDPILLAAGDYAERFGCTSEALRLYSRCRHEDATGRLATLQELQGNREQAAELWWEIALNSSVEMRSQQAVSRLIELHRSAHTLEQFREELSEAAQGSEVAPRIKSLFVRTLVALEDSEALTRYLQQYGSADELLAVLLELRRYPAAVALLRQQLAERPERRSEWLRRLAMVAIETGDKKLADEVLQDHELLASSGGLEFAGAVYALCGEVRRSAECYAEALRQTPERSELLLLWARSRQAAGEGAAVIAQAASELQEEQEPERFGVLVDVLLNLGASPEQLRRALSAVQRRLEQEPENLFFYQLAEDLAGELGDETLLLRLERDQLAVAPERRTLLLQKLLADAIQRRRTADALFYGRLLLGLQEVLSPDSCQLLVTLLVEQKQLVAAERCVRDADRADGGNSRLLALAGILAQNGAYAEAERLYRELLTLNPESVELLTQYAATQELQQAFRQAGEANLAALTILCRGRMVVNGQQGSADSAFERRLKPIMHAFATQAVTDSEYFIPLVAERLSTAPNPAQRAAWQSVTDRLQALLGALPNPSSAGSRFRHADRPVSPAELASTLRSLPDDAAAQRVREFFGTSARRSVQWRQLLNALDFEPGKETQKVLLEELDRCSSFELFADDRRLPYGMALKLRYSQRALAGSPESLEVLAAAARLRHQAGEGEYARTLAAMVYEELEGRGEPLTIPDVRWLWSLTEVYADAPGEPAGSGRAELQTLLAEREAEVTLRGESPVRRLILGLLYRRSEAYGKAQEQLSRAWDLDRNAFPCFWALRECVGESGRFAAWQSLLLQQVPTDQTAQHLYMTQLLPELRRSGRKKEAEALLPLWNSAMQEQERLLLARDAGTRDELAASFADYLWTTRDQSGSYRLFDRSGSPRMTSVRPGEGNVLGEIVRRIPERAGFLTYLLQGTLPGELGFSTLWNALDSLPPEAIPPFPAATVAGLLLRAKNSPDLLEDNELARVSSYLEHGLLPFDVARSVLPALPLESNEKAVAGVMASLLAGRELPAPAELQPLLVRLTPAQREAFNAAIADTPPRGERDDAAWVRLQLLYQEAPALFHRRLASLPVGPQSFLRLLQNPTVEVCRNYLRSSGGFPPWAELITVEPSLPELFAEALEELAATGELRSIDLVRHYAWLAVADLPSRRERWLAAAERHHRTLSEASLWLWDALRSQGRHQEAAALENQLKAVGIQVL